MLMGFGIGALRRALELQLCIWFCNGALRRALEIYLCILKAFGNGALRRALEIYLCVFVRLVAEPRVALWSSTCASSWVLATDDTYALLPAV